MASKGITCDSYDVKRVSRFIEAQQQQSSFHRLLHVLRCLPSFAENVRGVLVCGAGRMAWSADGCFLATRSDTLPNLVWVWDAMRMDLASILQQAAPVRSLSWSPAKSGPKLSLEEGGSRMASSVGASASPKGTLAVASEGPRVYLWSGEGASCVHIPFPAFCPSRVAWAPQGGALLLSDRESFCCAYPDEPAP